MSRIPANRYSEAIDRAWGYIPPGVARHLGHVQFVCGVSPTFAGFHAYADIDGDRSYSGTAHCAYPFHLRRPRAERVTTVFLPVPESPVTVIHELGHALHEVVGFREGTPATTDYARTNAYEAFAEFFTTWLLRGYGNEEALHSGQQTMSLLRSLDHA